jgi:hypothetical protein
MKTDSRRSDLIALALPTCCHCNGTGLRSAEGVCLCVERKVFKIVMERYRDIVEGELFIAPLSLENAGNGPKGLVRVGRPHEEFLADVSLVAKRTLDPLEYDVFRFHMLYGADHKACCKRLNIDRGTFFHAVYRVEAKAGRAFRTTAPYPIYPVNGYFYGVVRGRKIPATVVDEPAPPVPLRPPLATKAQRLEYIRAKLAEEPMAA